MKVINDKDNFAQESIIMQRMTDNNKWENIGFTNPAKIGDKVRIKYGDIGFVFFNDDDKRQYVAENVFTVFDVETDNNCDSPLKLSPKKCVKLIS